MLNIHKLIDHTLICWCLSCKSSVGGCITRGVGHESICEGLLWAPSTRALQLCWICMSLTCLLALSLQSCLKVLAELGFPGSKKPEPKFSSALDAGPAALQRKTTLLAFRLYKPARCSRVSKSVYSQVVQENKWRGFFCLLLLFAIYFKGRYLTLSTWFSFFLFLFCLNGAAWISVRCVKISM